MPNYKRRYNKLAIGPKFKFIKNKTTLKGLDENEISLRYKVKSEKNVELEMVYGIDKESILSLTKKEALKKEIPSVQEIEKFLEYKHCTLTDYNNITQKGVTPGITSENPEDFVGKYNLTSEDLEYINGIDPLERIRNYFVDMVKVVKKKVIGIEESFEFEKLFDKILNS